MFTSIVDANGFVVSITRDEVISESKNAIRMCSEDGDITSKIDE